MNRFKRKTIAVAAYVAVLAMTVTLTPWQIPKQRPELRAVSQDVRQAELSAKDWQQRFVVCLVVSILVILGVCTLWYVRSPRLTIAAYLGAVASVCLSLPPMLKTIAALNAPDFIPLNTFEAFVNATDQAVAWQQWIVGCAAASALVVLGICVLWYVLAGGPACPRCRSKRVGDFCAGCGAEMRHLALERL